MARPFGLGKARDGIKSFIKNQLHHIQKQCMTMSIMEQVLKIAIQVITGRSTTHNFLDSFKDLTATIRKESFMSMTWELRRLAKRASRPQRARQGFDPPRRWTVSCAKTMQTKRHVLCQMGHHATQSYLEKPKYFTILVTTVRVSSVRRKGTEMVARCWCTLVALMGCGSLQSRLFITV